MSKLVVQLVSGLAVLGAGVALLFKGDTQTGVALVVAGAAEMGVNLGTGHVSLK